MKFSEDNKEVKEFQSNYFGFGVHKVQIAKVTLDETAKGQEFMEIEVVGANGEEDSARIWFTSDAAINFSFNVLRQIIIHNTPEEKRDKMRELVDALPDTPALAAMMQGTIGKACWFTKYLDPERKYKAKDGTMKPSVNKNVYGYEPKLKPELLPATGPVDLGSLGVGQRVEHLPGEVPFASAGDAAGSVPADEAWD